MPVSFKAIFSVHLPFIHSLFNLKCLHPIIVWLVQTLQGWQLSYLSLRKKWHRELLDSWESHVISLFRTMLIMVCSFSPKHIIVRLKKPKTKKSLKTAREILKGIFKGITTRLSAYFSRETKIEHNGIMCLVLKENNCQLRILYPEKIFKMKTK